MKGLTALRIGRLGIRAKVLASPLIILLAFISVGVFTVTHFQSLDREIGVIATELAPKTAVATEMITELYRMRMSVQDFTSRRAEAQVERFNAAHAEMQRLLQEAAAGGDGGRREVLDRLSGLTEQYAQVFNESLVPAGAKVDRLTEEVLDTHGVALERSLKGIGETARYSGNAELSSEAEAAARDAMKARMGVQQYILEPTPMNKSSAMVALASLETRLSSVAEQMGETREVRDSRKALADYKSGFEALSQTLPAFLATKREELDTLGPKIGDAARDLQGNVFDDLEGMARQAGAESTMAIRVQVLIMAVAAVGGILLALLITRTVVRPVRQASSEIGALLEDIRAGHADLNQRLSVTSRDEVGSFIGSVNAFLDTLQEVIESISGATQRLAQSATSLSQVTERTMKGSEEQRQEIEQVATAMNEMAATAEEIARNTADTASAAEQSTQATDKGRGVVNQTVDAIDQLAVQVEQGASTVMKLQEESDAIGKVLDVIREVAEQTNLLALNAAIEASRAGEAGRGFAVVAEEVRSLASRVQDSTQEIEQIIDRLQAGAQEAAKTMEASQRSARETVERASEAGDALSMIAEGINRINDMATQIANAAEEQTATAESINQSVIKANKVVDDVTQDIKTVSTSSTELNQMSEELRQLVARFQT